MPIRLLLFDPDAEVQRLLMASPALAQSLAISTVPELGEACAMARGRKYDIVIMALETHRNDGTPAPTASEGAAAAEPMVMALLRSPPGAAATLETSAHWLRYSQVSSFVEAFVDTAVAGSTAAPRSQSVPTAAARVGPLSARERQVLVLLAEGNTSKQIATLLNVSPHTVDAHRASIMKKLHIHTLAGLVRYALSEPPEVVEQPSIDSN